MDNPIDMLTQLMNNPKALDGIKDILNNSDNNKQEPVNRSETPSNPIDLSFLTQLLSENKQTAQALGKLKEMYDAYSDKNDPSITLLNDLTPFLSSKRADNMSRITQIAKAAKALNLLNKG